MLTLMLLVACGDKDETTDDTGTTDLFGTYIFVTDPDGNSKSEPSGGDLSCYTPGDTWLTTSADPSCVAEQAFSGVVEDFETGDEVPDALLELWWADSTDGARSSQGGDGVVRRRWWVVRRRWGGEEEMGW